MCSPIRDIALGAGALVVRDRTPGASRALTFGVISVFLLFSSTQWAAGSPSEKLAKIGELGALANVETAGIEAQIGASLLPGV
jgi:hypothetical protein